MSFGIEVYNSSGDTILSMDSVVGKVIGTGIINYPSNTLGQISVTISGLLVDDILSIQTDGNQACVFTISQSGEVVTINRTAAYQGSATIYRIIALRLT